LETQNSLQSRISKDIGLSFCRDLKKCILVIWFSLNIFG
jgi:hypothetical protein